MGFIDDLTGATAARAAKSAARMQQQGITEGMTATREATEQGLGFLEPFAQIGQPAIEKAGFLTDPQAQFEFLQQNPLFQASLGEATTQTQGLAAARGRLSAGDTLQQLSQNVLLSAAPLITQQKQSIMDQLRLGAGVAGSQANVAIGEGTTLADLATSSGDVGAAGQVGAAQARGAGAQNLLTTGLTAFGLSDKRLKTNIQSIGEENGHNIYSWDWNGKARDIFGLSGSSFGVLADEVALKTPDAITYKDGFMMVNYPMIGVQHGG